MRMHVGQRGAGLAVTEQAHGRELRMAGAEPQQLRADESGGSEDGDVDHGRSYAVECIIMQYRLSLRADKKTPRPEPGRFSPENSG